MIGHRKACPLWDSKLLDEWSVTDASHNRKRDSGLDPQGHKPQHGSGRLGQRQASCLRTARAPFVTFESLIVTLVFRPKPFHAPAPFLSLLPMAENRIEPLPLVEQGSKRGASGGEQAAHKRRSAKPRLAPVRLS